MKLASSETKSVYHITKQELHDKLNISKNEELTGDTIHYIAGPKTPYYQIVTERKS